MPLALRRNFPTPARPLIQRAISISWPASRPSGRSPRPSRIWGVREWLGPARQLDASTSPIRQRYSLCCLREILDFKNLTVKMPRFEGDVDWANTAAPESTPSRHYCGISAKLDKLPRCFRPRGASPISIGLRFRALRNLLARIDTRFALHAEEHCSPTVTACLSTEPDAGPGML